jgi:hypothetical protein
MMRVRHFACVIPLAAVLVFVRAAQPVPSQLSALAAKARLESPIVGWCRGEFRPDRSGAYAVAIQPAASSGRYLVVEADATVLDLASFPRSADLSCYTPAEARKLHASITQSATITGRIAPRWRTTVVCAFVDDTHAVCWQYSPRERAFVKVGEWLT